MPNEFPVPPETAPAEVKLPEPAPAGAAEYRSIAVFAEDEEVTSPLTPNTPIGDPVLTPTRPDRFPEPVVVDGEVTAMPVEYYSDADGMALGWSNRLVYDAFPSSLLWQPPMANQREPRMYGKFTNANDQSTIDTALGGEFGFGRIGPADRCHEGLQIDGFGVVFSRFNEDRLNVANDFRAGIPITYAKGPWAAKVSFEHTSTHLGDEYIEATGRRQAAHVRDEVVFGLSRRFWNQLRLYGQYGYSFSTSVLIRDYRDRYDFGLEWSKQQDTGWRGQPFAALDFDLRSDQDYEANMTFQLGWQWLKPWTRHSARVAFEVYSGKSPFGQFYREFEDWVGVGGFYDW